MNDIWTWLTTAVPITRLSFILLILWGIFCGYCLGRRR